MPCLSLSTRLPELATCPWQNAWAFNQQLDWDTSSVTTLDYTFWNCWAFNQPLAWDTSAAQFMWAIFENVNLIFDGCTKRHIYEAMRGSAAGCYETAQQVSVRDCSFDGQYGDWSSESFCPSGRTPTRPASLTPLVTTPSLPLSCGFAARQSMRTTVKPARA